MLNLDACAVVQGHEFSMNDLVKLTRRVHPHQLLESGDDIGSPRHTFLQAVDRYSDKFRLGRVTESIAHEDAEELLCEAQAAGRDPRR